MDLSWKPMPLTKLHVAKAERKAVGKVCLHIKDKYSPLGHSLRWPRDRESRFRRRPVLAVDHIVSEEGRGQAMELAMNARRSMPSFLAFSSKRHRTRAIDSPIPRSRIQLGIHPAPQNRRPTAVEARLARFRREGQRNSAWSGAPSWPAPWLGHGLPR